MDTSNKQESERPDWAERSQMGTEPEPSQKALRVQKLIIRMRLGYVPASGDLADLSTDELRILTYEAEYIARGFKSPSQAAKYPNLTPDVLANAIAEAAPLKEGEKTLMVWLEKVGGIVYGAPFKPNGFGWVVLSNRPESMGAHIPSAPQHFPTFSQMLEFALAYATDTITGQTFGKAAGQVATRIGLELSRLGVDADTIQFALKATEDKLRAEAEETEQKVKTALDALGDNPTDV